MAVNTGKSSCQLEETTGKAALLLMCYLICNILNSFFTKWKPSGLICWKKCPSQSFSDCADLYRKYECSISMVLLSHCVYHCGETGVVPKMNFWLKWPFSTLLILWYKYRIFSKKCKLNTKEHSSESVPCVCGLTGDTPALDITYIHTMGWWIILISEPISSSREWVDWEQMEHKVVFSVPKQLFFLPFCLYSCQLQMPREIKFYMSYRGDTTVDYNSFCLCSVKPAGPSIEQNSSCQWVGGS